MNNYDAQINAQMNDTANNNAAKYMTGEGRVKGYVVVVSTYKNADYYMANGIEDAIGFCNANRYISILAVVDFGNYESTVEIARATKGAA